MSGCRSCNALPVSPAFTPQFGKMVDRLLSLGSLALRSSDVSTSLFTTMAAADSSYALASEASPGKVYDLSARAARLYTTRLSVTVGFCARSHAHRTRYASLPFHVLTVVPLLRPSFELKISRSLPWLSLRLSSLFPVISFHLTRSYPCRAHERRRPRRLPGFKEPTGTSAFPGGGCPRFNKS